MEDDKKDKYVPFASFGCKHGFDNTNLFWDPKTVDEGETMTDDRIKQLRALCGAATPGEWKAEPRHILQNTKDYLVIPPKYPHCYPQSVGDFFEADVLFIAAARTALPEALDEIERLRAALERK